MDLLSVIWSFFSLAVTPLLVFGALGYFYGSAILGFISKRINYHFDSQLEVLRIDLSRSNEEFEALRMPSYEERKLLSSHIADVLRDRSVVLQSKRITLAENVLNYCLHLKKGALTVEMAKMLNWQEISKDPFEPKVQEGFRRLNDLFEINDSLEELKKFEVSSAPIYLHEHTLNLFQAYSSISLNANLRIK